MSAPERSQEHRARHPRPPLASILFWVVIVGGILGIGGGYAAFGVYAASQQHRADDLRQTVVEKSATIDKKDAQLAKLFANYAKSVNDCQQSAGCRSTTPSPDVIQQIIEGTPGATGPTGPGASDAQVYLQVEAYCTTSGFCVGAQGAQGAPGSSIVGPQGPAGPAGADSTVPGPQGPAGADGQPPVSWTYTDPLGLQHTCTRTDPFDASAPTYTCS